MVFSKKEHFQFYMINKKKVFMDIDLKKEREKIVSGSANVFYDEEVKLLGKDTHLIVLWKKTWIKSGPKSGILAAGAMKFLSQGDYKMK